MCACVLLAQAPHSNTCVLACVRADPAGCGPGHKYPPKSCWLKFIEPGPRLVNPPRWPGNGGLDGWLSGTLYKDAGKACLLHSPPVSMGAGQSKKASVNLTHRSSSVEVTEPPSRSIRPYIEIEGRPGRLAVTLYKDVYVRREGVPAHAARPPGAAGNMPSSHQEFRIELQSIEQTLEKALISKALICARPPWSGAPPLLRGVRGGLLAARRARRLRVPERLQPLRLR